MTPAEPDNNDPAWYAPQPGNPGYQPPGNQPPGTEWNPYQASWTQSGSIDVQLQAGSLPVGDESEAPNPAVAAESSTIVAELPEESGSITLQQALAESSVYCQLQDDSSAFLVVIQNWTELNEADRSTLSQMIWLAAGRSVKDRGEEGDDFAVALVSNGLLVEISLGHHERSDHFDAGLEHRGSADDEMRRALEEFFEPVQAEAMPDAIEPEAAAQ